MSAPILLPSVPATLGAKDAISKVVVDGRFIQDFASNPEHTGSKLGFTMAKKEVTALKAQSTTTSSPSVIASGLNHQVFEAGEIFIVIVIVIVLVFVPSCRTKTDLIKDPNQDGKV